MKTPLVYLDVITFNNLLIGIYTSSLSNKNNCIFLRCLKLTVITEFALLMWEKETRLCVFYNTTKRLHGVQGTCLSNIIFPKKVKTYISTWTGLNRLYHGKRIYTLPIKKRYEYWLTLNWEKCKEIIQLRKIFFDR